MDIFLTLLVMICLLVVKGFFSGCEIAMVNADKVKLNALAGKGHKGSHMVLEEFRSPEMLLGTTLVGTNIATIVLTTIGTLLVIQLVGENGEWIAFLFFMMGLGPGWAQVAAGRAGLRRLGLGGWGPAAGLERAGIHDWQQAGRVPQSFTFPSRALARAVTGG